jgi:formate/nitrite transporter FocA (FNT family)
MAEEADRESVERASMLPSRLIYEVIRREGEEELNRPLRSLIWAGIAAGALISFSVIAEAVLRSHLPDNEFRFLIENLGYAFGFILVIMGNMQLFTENTIKTVLPVVADPTLYKFQRSAGLWGVVLGANLVGALAAGLFFAYTAALPEEIFAAAVELSEHGTGFDAGTGFARAIPAGILVAAIVWMTPQAESAAFFLIGTFTWLIAAGDFTHVVVGSFEMWFLMVQGQLNAFDAVFRFFLPVLAGNIVGGTAVFTLLAWGQVKEEVAEDNVAKTEPQE